MGRTARARSTLGLSCAPASFEGEFQSRTTTDAEPKENGRVVSALVTEKSLCVRSEVDCDHASVVPIDAQSAMRAAPPQRTQSKRRPWPAAVNGGGADSGGAIQSTCTPVAS